MNITDFLQSIKAHTDELAILGAPIGEEDLTEKILDELRDNYKELVHVIKARDNSISFDELHEKMIKDWSENSPPISLHSSTSLLDPTEYRTIVGNMQYLSLTHLDITNTVNKLSQYMH